MNRVEQKPDMSNGNITYWNRIKKHFFSLIEKIKRLQGNPHYVAMGMAIGVFVGITPTIPFHTALAIALAFVFRGSKPAAAIGVWVSNPVTIPLFYYGSYKVGVGLFGGPGGQMPDFDKMIHTLESSIPMQDKLDLIKVFLAHNLEIALLMLAGGVLLAIVPALLSYYLTRRLMFRAKQGVRVISTIKQKRRETDRPGGEETEYDDA
ncbi:MAG: DUF2062 domain-containing protein [Desulfobacterales bacterium]|nr:DUF2062 domain-containing protein [Desulfobacterales bacterium]